MELSVEDWDRQYDAAMQWRDWDTCERLIKEREFWNGVRNLKR